MNKPIAVIDSGVGGISVTWVLINKLPHESFIYLADSKNCPYGQKSRADIYKLTSKMVDFLLKKEIKLLVIACNTITVTSISKLRRRYPKLPIIGIVPVVKTAVEQSVNKKIGIYSTQVTAKSKYQKDLINKFTKGYLVLNKGSERLVSLIEKHDFQAIEMVLKQELVSFTNENIDVLALGCSHFPLIKDQIQKLLPKVLILDSAEAIARQVGRVLVSNKILPTNKESSYTFYTTGNIRNMEYFMRKLTIKGKTERISLP